MNDAYSTALMLLFIGMLTVFIILASVVIVGKLIIFVINRYVPEAENENLKKVKDFSFINGKKLSAIVAAVNIYTNGRAQISKIEKID